MSPPNVKCDSKNIQILASMTRPLCEKIKRFPPINGISTTPNPVYPHHFIVGSGGGASFAWALLRSQLSDDWRGVRIVEGSPNHQIVAPSTRAHKHRPQDIVERVVFCNRLGRTTTDEATEQEPDGPTPQWEAH